MKMFALLAASAIALAACSSQPPAPTRQAISEITVNTDLKAVGNAGAVTYWKGLSDDLQVALAAEFVNDISPDGALLNVDVDEISLANSYTSKFAGEMSRLSGLVTLTDKRGQELSRYTVTATSSQAMAYVPTTTGKVIAPGSAEFYAALVKAFARGVEQTVNTPPSGS